MTPGAEMSGLIRPSAVLPRLEKYACLKPFAPRSAIAPTVSASAAAPGDEIVHVPGPALPAATATTMPGGVRAVHGLRRDVGPVRAARAGRARG